MDCEFVIFILLIIFGYIVYKRKTVEGNINQKRELELVTFSNSSQKIINEITSKQKELNILLKMKKTEEIKEKREELFKGIDTIIGDWIDDNNKKFKDAENEKQRILMIAILNKLKVENNELNIIYKNKELTDEKIETSKEKEDQVGEEEEEEEEEDVKQEEDDIFIDAEEEEAEEVSEEVAEVSEEVAEVVAEDGTKVTNYEDISIVDYEENVLDIENVFIFGGIFFLLLCIFGVIMLLTTEEGRRFYRNNIKKYVDMFFTKKEYNYYNV